MSVTIYLPTVGETEGTLAAEMINQALTDLADYIDTHGHIATGGLIGSGALNITSDVDFQNNASLLQKYCGFTNSLLAPSVGFALYVKDDGTPPPLTTGDLWYNNGLIDIQITDGASVLTTTDGFVDDYTNNMPGEGKAGFSIGSNRYTFSDGSGATAPLSGVSHVTFKTMLSAIDYGEYSLIVGLGDDGSGSDASGMLILQSSAVNQNLAQCSLVAYGVGMQPPGYASDLSPVTALMSNSRLYLSAQIAGTDPTAQIQINKDSTVFAGDILPAVDAGTSPPGYKLGHNKYGFPAIADPYWWSDIFALVHWTGSIADSVPPDGTPTVHVENNAVTARGTFIVVNTGAGPPATGTIDCLDPHWNIAEWSGVGLLYNDIGDYSIKVDSYLSTSSTVVISSNDISGAYRICQASYDAVNNWISVRVCDETGTPADTDFSLVVVGK